MFQLFNSFLCLFRLVPGFTCSGLTETQYVNSCKASRIGHVEQQYISTGNVIVLVCLLQMEFLLFNWAFAFALYFCSTVCLEWKVHILIQRNTKLSSLLFHLLPLHQEPGQIPGQPGKGWSGQAFWLFGQAYRENTAW